MQYKKKLLFIPFFLSLILITSILLGAYGFLTKASDCKGGINGAVVSKINSYKENVIVEVYNENNELVWSGITLSDGKFDTGLTLPEGNYKVIPSKTNFVFTPEYKVVEVKCNNKVFVSFTVMEKCKGGITGTVTPIDYGYDVEIKIYSDDTDELVWSGKTDRYGKFTTGNTLYKGKYNVIPSKSGLIFEPASQTVDVICSRLANASFKVKQDCKSGIKGTVIPVNYAECVKINIYNDSNELVWNGSTDEEGVFDTDMSLPEGKYKVIPSKEGYYFKPENQSINTICGKVVSLFSQFICDKLCIGAIEGTIKPKEHGENSTIKIYNEDGELVWTGNANEEGYFFTGFILDTGTTYSWKYRVVPSMDQAVYTPSSIEVPIKCGEKSVVEFTCENPCKGGIQGAINPKEHKYPIKISIYSEEDGKLVWSGSINDEGEFDTGFNLPIAKYKVVLTSAGYYFDPKSIIVQVRCKQKVYVSFNSIEMSDCQVPVNITIDGRCSDDCKNLVTLYVYKKNENGSYISYCILTSILDQFDKSGQASALLPKGEYMITPKKVGCGYRCGGVSAVGCNCSSCKCSGENAIFAITCDCTEIRVSFYCY